MNRLKLDYKEEVLAEGPPFRVGSNPELQALYRLHLAVIRTVEIPFCGPDMGMPHQRLDGSKVIPIIQEGSSKGMTNLIRKILR